MDNVSAFTEFILSKSFKLVNEKKELGIVVYEQNGLYVKVIKDKDGKHFIDVSRTNNEGWEGWYSMDVIRFLLLKSHYVKDGTTDFEQLSQFFIERYEEIKEAFRPSKFPKAEASLKALEKERAKVLFGYEEPQHDAPASWFDKITNRFKK